MSIELSDRSPWPSVISHQPSVLTRRSALFACFLAVFALLVLAGTPAAHGRVLVADEGDQTVAVTTAPASEEDPAEIARKIDEEILPIPSGDQIPLSTLRARGGPGWSSFRTPFPAVPVWNPPGPKRVGLQAGHWQYADAPDELAELRSNPGTSGGGKAEWEVTLDVAQRAADMLRASGIEVDVLPTTIPVRYRANAFVAIHADGESGGVLHGFKVARPGFSGTPEADQSLVNALNDQYGTTTELPRMDNQISLRMTYYYAFNARRYQHAVAPGVPQAIIETGFLTNWGDRNVLIGNPDLIARGIANGVLKFLQTTEQPGGAG